ncbi:transglycosylase domain-containing protein, partial [bacterium]|nr:transglycosylase domain-containing protein [bacterium]
MTATSSSSPVDRAHFKKEDIARLLLRWLREVFKEKGKERYSAEAIKRRLRRKYTDVRYAAPLLETLLYEPTEKWFSQHQRPGWGRVVGRFLLPLLVEPVGIVVGGISVVLGRKFGFPFAFTPSILPWFIGAFLLFQLAWHFLYLVQINFWFFPRLENARHIAFSIDKVMITIVTSIITLPVAFLLTHFFLLSPLFFNTLLLSAVLIPHVLIMRVWDLFPWKIPLCLRIGFVAITAVAVVGVEARFGFIHSYFFRYLNSQITWMIKDGKAPSSKIAYPTTGPQPKLRGYTIMPKWIPSLVKDFTVNKQARQSPQLVTLLKRGLMPRCFDPAKGLVIRDQTGTAVFKYKNPYWIESFKEIPSIVIKMFAVRENQELLQLLCPDDPQSIPVRNWVVEEARLLKASVKYTIKKLTGIGKTPGASTILTQDAKLRFSPGGRTQQSPQEKLRQMTNASLLLHSGDQRKMAEEGVLNYINEI